MLSIILRLGGLLLGTINPDYDLLIIEEEDVPLAAGPVKNEFFVFAVIAIILLAALIIVAVWFIKWRGLREHLITLRVKAGNTDSKVSLSLRNVRDEIASLEADLSAQLL